MRQVLPRLLMLVLLALSAIWTQPAAAQEWTSAPEVPVWEEPPPPPPPEGWQTLHGPFVRVHGAPEHHATLLRVARHVSEALPRLADALQVPIGDTIHIYLAENDARFRELQPGDPPSWADATAYPRRGIIYLRAPRARGGLARPIEQVVDHELVHILLGRAFAPHPAPSWLQEGVAQVYAGEYDPQTTRDLARGLLFGELHSLESLARGFPADPFQARLAYAQSADFIAYVQRQHGPQAVGKLVRELASGQTIEAAVYRSTGTFLRQLDRDWRQGLASSPLSLAPLFEHADIIWAFGGLLLIVGGVLRRRRFHQRLREMEAEERLVDELLAQARRERSSSVEFHVH